MYSDVAANLGRYPNTLDDLYEGYVQDPRSFLCPSVSVHHAGNGRLKQCDYFYLPDSGPTHGAEIVAFCRWGNHESSEGTYVLTGDGHVERVTWKEVRDLMRQRFNQPGAKADPAWLKDLQEALGVHD